MGYTSFTKRIIQNILDNEKPTSILDLGAQNDFELPHLPAPYISEWYRAKGIHYDSIDLNGENGSWQIDLGYPIKKERQYDLVVDAGTSEHVGREGAFSWEAIYNCWLNKHEYLRTGGVMYNENPETGNWPGHGFQYYTHLFYEELAFLNEGLASMTDYHIIVTSRQAAMGNTTDGWNIVSVLEKHSDRFPSLEEFKTLSLKNS